MIAGMLDFYALIIHEFFISTPAPFVKTENYLEFFKVSLVILPKIGIVKETEKKPFKENRMKLKIHEAANIFPMNEETIKDLAEDIRSNGQLQPVMLYRGTLLDGRRRVEACKILGIEPKSEIVNPVDPVGFVLSLNLHRRHLTASQKAMIGAKARSVYDKEALERKRLGGKQGNDVVNGMAQKRAMPTKKLKASEVAAAAVGCGSRGIEAASKVLKKGTKEVIEAVESGDISVTKAEKIVDLPKEAQKETVKNGFVATQEYKAPESKPYEKGVGFKKAQEAINALKEIPCNDPQKKEAFNFVMTFLKNN